MKHGRALKFEFVQFIPDHLGEDTLYISMEFATAAHKCCCGCGNEVVTPFSPTDWKVTFDGVSISLSPSIGNWNFPCQSHYWIQHNRIEWAPRWSRANVEAGRSDDRRAKEGYFAEGPATTAKERTGGGASNGKRGLWERIKHWLRLQ